MAVVQHIDHPYAMTAGAHSACSACLTAIRGTSQICSFSFGEGGGKRAVKMESNPGGLA